MEQKDSYEKDILEIAAEFINTENEDPKKHVTSAEDALNGAKDIIAETISDNADFRKSIRALTHNHGTVVS